MKHFVKPRFGFLFLICLALVACHGNSSSRYVPQATTHRAHGLDEIVGSGNDPIICDRTATPDPTTGSWGNYNCFLKPNASITFAGLQMEPFPGKGPPWTCTPTAWSIQPWSQFDTIPPYLTATISPATTGQSDPSCERLDTVDVTLTSGSVPADFDRFIIKAIGSYSLCSGTNCATGGNEEVTTFTLYPGLHLKDIELNKHIENQSVTHVAGQYNHLRVELSGPPNETFAPTGCTWSMPAYFPTDAVSGYVTADKAQSAIPTQSTPIPSGTLPPPDVTWYNTRAEDPAALNVSCDVVEPTTNTTLQLTSTTNMAFETPSPHVSIAYGSIAVSSAYHASNCPTLWDFTWLAYGDPCTGPGIRWTYSASADSAESNGSLAVWQVENSVDNSQTLNDGSTLEYIRSNCADGGLPYIGQSSGPVSTSATWTDVDAPAEQLISPPTWLTYTRVRMTFDDFYMYRPPASLYTGTQSIWISLGHSRWGWDASTSYASPAPAPSATPDPSHYSTPIVFSQSQPASVEDTQQATPSIPTTCV